MRDLLRRLFDRLFGRPAAAGARRELDEPMTCGRRFDGLQVRDWPVDPPAEDRWSPASNLGPICSYCGSLHPAVLLAKLRAGWRLVGSDKPYKWYLADRNGATAAKVYTVHLTRDDCEELLTALGEGDVEHDLYVRPWLPALASKAPAWLADG
jgi:hypothetical protein